MQRILLALLLTATATSALADNLFDVPPTLSSLEEVIIWESQRPTSTLKKMAPHDQDKTMTILTYQAVVLSSILSTKQYWVASDIGLTSASIRTQQPGAFERFFELLVLELGEPNARTPLPAVDGPGAFELSWYETPIADGIQLSKTQDYTRLSVYGPK